LGYVLDISTCISVPPYSHLTAAKLLAALMTTNEVRDLYAKHYAERPTWKRRRILTDVVLVTATGAFGRNAVAYKGFRRNGESLFRFVGYTAGYSTFQVPPALYGRLKKFVGRYGRPVDGTAGGGPNPKLRILRMAARMLKVPEELLVRPGHRRAVFAAPLAFNFRSILRGSASRPHYIDFSVEEAICTWRERFLARRLGDHAVRQVMRQFDPEEVRVSKILKHEGPSRLGGTQ